MTPRHIKRIVIAALGAVLLGLSIQQGFGNAWQSQYTVAFAPAKASKAPVPAPQSAKPQAVQEPDQTAPKEQPLSKRIVEYHMNVSLRDDGQHLDGEQTVTWTNPGKKTVSELYFHLYPNAFLSNHTTFMKESGGKLRQDKATASSQGHMKLLLLQTLEGESLLPRLQYVQPDDGNEDDFTLAKIQLPEPVGPNQSVTLKFGYEVKLPEVFARMGYSGSFVMAGQWFPKIAAYETAGTRGRSAEGWNVHQYHGNSEFYSNFGIYSVKISVPDSHTVAATGFQAKDVSTKDGRKSYTFYADDVHDFAWAASPDFIYEEIAYSDKNIPGVRIKLYLDPEHEGLKERYIHAAKSALSHFAKWYGQYPYSTLSIVVPPAGAGGAGGMEYPTLITSLAADSSNPGYSLERTVVHEIGHQYWYGMVASNEFEEAWLDEGFTSYAEDKVMASAYGIRSDLQIESSYITAPKPLKQSSWSYGSHDDYAENVYMRAKLVLLGIEKQVGERTMQRIMRTYFQKYKFKYPTTADFQRVVESVTKKKWQNYFNQFVYDDQMADFSVESIQSRTVTENGKEQHEASILIKRHGGIVGTIPIQLHFTDGTSVTLDWEGDQPQIQMKHVHSAPIEWVMIDPDHTNVLDNKVINNFMKAELPQEIRTRGSLTVSKAIEALLGALGW